MPRINVPFIVDGMRIVQNPPVRLVAGGQNYFYATFEICETWKKLSNIKAVFTRGEVSKLITLTESDDCLECRIPWEVMTEKGVFEVGIFGGDTLLTNMEYVVVDEGCCTDGSTPEPPTPDWFQQVEGDIEEIKESLDNVDSDVKDLTKESLTEDEKTAFMENTGLDETIGGIEETIGDIETSVGEVETAIDEILELQEAHINGDVNNLPMWTGGSY